MDSYITGTSCCVRIREGVIGVIKVANKEEIFQHREMESCIKSILLFTYFRSTL